MCLLWLSSFPESRPQYIPGDGFNDTTFNDLHLDEELGLLRPVIHYMNRNHQDYHSSYRTTVSKQPVPLTHIVHLTIQCSNV